MNNTNRLKNSMNNMVNGLLSQFISLILSFVVRTFFVIYLSKEYLGVNGLFANILTVLSLAELGFGTAMIYSMYNPLANDDKNKLQILMRLYSKVYTLLGIVVALLGISFIPFMDYIVKDRPNVDNLTLIYIMFLADSVLSYFFSYKRSILSADQKEYILSKYRYIFTIIKSVLQISILILFRSFILYLLVQIIATIMENIYISYKVDKLYPFLKYENKDKLPVMELKRITNDVKALVLTKFGHVMLNGTDNIIISTFVGITWVGTLSNYTLIINSVVMVLSQISASVTGSIGNYIAKESKENQYNLFKKVDFINYWLYGFSTIALIILINPFIELWIGQEYVLNQITVVVLAINFAISGIMSTLWTFRFTMGLFTQGKYRPIIAAFFNIILSVILGKSIGLVGVLLGTTISRLLVNLWFDPYIIYKYGFEKNVVKYYISYILRIALISVIAIAIYFIKIIVLKNGINLINFIILFTICIFLPNIILIVIYNKKTEFIYVKKILKSILVKINLFYKL